LRVYITPLMQLQSTAATNSVFNLSCGELCGESVSASSIKIFNK
jgi:hypothetical protein